MQAGAGKVESVVAAVDGGERVAWVVGGVGSWDPRRVGEDECEAFVWFDGCIDAAVADVDVDVEVGCGGVVSGVFAGDWVGIDLGEVAAEG